MVIRIVTLIILTGCLACHTSSKNINTLIASKTNVLDSLIKSEPALRAVVTNKDTYNLLKNSL